MNKIFLGFVAWMMISASAWAQTSYPSPGGGYVDGKVQMCVNASNQAVPCNSSGVTAATVQTTPYGASGAYSAATVGTTDSTIVASGAATHFLDLVNNSGTATVCINFGAAATISGTVCAAGELTLSPLYHRSWESAFVPTDAIHAIASAASVPMAVGVK